MDQSLIEAVFKYHSKSNAAITCLQDQLQSLEVLRDSAKQSFTAVQKSGAELERSTRSILESSSHLIPSPDFSPISRKGTANSGSSSPTVNQKFTTDSSSPGNMRLSESQMSAFDVSAILEHVTPPRANGSRTRFQDLSVGSCDGDELLGILEKISSTGHQLQVELKNAQIRETHLQNEIKLLKSIPNDHPVISQSLTKSTSCQYCRNGTQQLNGETNKMLQVNERCEKLQNAMLSLQEENIKLNRIMRNPEHAGIPKIIKSAADDLTINEMRKRVQEREREISVLQQRIDQLSDALTAAENSLQQERMQLHKTPDQGDQQSQKLSAELKRKCDDLQMRNETYLERIETLENKLASVPNHKVTEETYSLRIDDLHAALLSKQDEIDKLKENLKNVEKTKLEEERRNEKMKRSDFTKRKEVLMLCEKYEQLKLNRRRLESALRESQEKLQEVNVRCWALETSSMKANDENEILKEQLKIHESMTSTNGPSGDNNGLLKSYQCLMEKYEVLLDLRLEEYQRIRKNAKDKKTLKQRGSDRESKDLKPKNHDFKLEDIQSMLSESMRKRQQDYQRFYMGDSCGNIQRNIAVVENFNKTAQQIAVGEALEPKYQYPMYERSHQDHLSPSVSIESRTKAIQTNIEAAMPGCEYSSSKHSSLTIKDLDRHGRSRSLPGNERNVRTSTPVKTSPRFYANSSLIEHKSEKNDRKPSRDSQYHSSGYPKSRYNPRSQTQYRSKSLSPIRVSDRGDKYSVLEEYRPSSSRESQKSVSFVLSPNHRRSKSSNLVFNRSDLSRSSTPHTKVKYSGKRMSLSPVEVLEKVKSAYQEEYLHNMAGVNLVLSAENSPPVNVDMPSNKAQTPSSLKEMASTDIISMTAKSSGAINPSHMGALLCAERYKKNTESVKSFLNKNYSPHNDCINLYNTSGGSSSISPKSILRKSSSIQTPNTSNEQTHVEAPSPKNEDEIPLVVREREKDTWDLPSTCRSISPPEMFRDRDGKFKRRLRYDCLNKTSVDVDIIDVEPKVVNPNNTISSLESSQMEDSFSVLHHNVLTADNKFGTLKSEQFNQLKGEDGGIQNRKGDLTIPVQLLNAMKDDDIESIGHSSVSSTRDHIGRYEFLQEMQTTLKTPAFSYQRNPESTPRNDEATAGKEMGTGLSARQQEYADKLVKKYMKKT